MNEAINAALYEARTKRPGMFEGQHRATPYFYELANNEGADEILQFNDGEIIDVFRVTPEEKQAFSLLHPYFVVTVTETGFVLGREWSTAKLQNMKKALTQEIDESADAITGAGDK